MIFPSALYTAAQVRELDRRAIDEFNTPGIVLMKRAGQAVFDELMQRWPDFSHLSIFCGAGNNGGDGYIIAALAAQQNLSVTLVETNSPDSASKPVSDAATARRFALEQGVTPIEVADWLVAPHFESDTVIVDALLGTGFTGQLRAPYAELIGQINASSLPVVAVDIPSGLSADTGAVLEQAIQARLTVTFIGMKIGLFTGQGRAQSGDIVFDDLGVPDAVYEMEAQVELLDYDCLYQDFAVEHPRQLTNHKGHHGHLVVVGGDHGFAGAALMAAEAAARVGVGLVSAVTHKEQAAAYAARLPEAMVCDASDWARVQALLNSASAIVVGPGLGTRAWGQKLLQAVLNATAPSLLDADALNILSTGCFNEMLPLRNSLITPHPGEAGRLLALSNEQVNQDRIAAVDMLQQKIARVALLKGSGTLIRTDHQRSLCPYGNPGMGTGGMGDVLSGIVGGLMAQGLALQDAAKLGACLHGYAADRQAMENGMRGLLATDLITEVRQLINGQLT